MKRAFNLLFDLDGTLANNQRGIENSIGHALARLGHPAPTPAALEGVVGPPLRQTFARLLPAADVARVEVAVGLYRERYRELGWAENELYPGVDAALATLAQAGHALFVCTSKPRLFALRILEHFGLAKHFRGIYGPELDGRFDHKDELLGHLLRTEALAPEHCLMIGDREHDALAARAHGVAALGVLYGFGSAAELTAAGVAALVTSPGDLPEAVKAWGRRRGEASTVS